MSNKYSVLNNINDEDEQICDLQSMCSGIISQSESELSPDSGVDIPMMRMSGAVSGCRIHSLKVRTLRFLLKERIDASVK